ncbi:hypothetical protein GOBAR_DD34353 [Gossypium barbadense]|nr:hypothetical protein GOBAR_DD34353 [Gossypium barbadense]
MLRAQKCLFCCDLWALRLDRNRNLHEGKNQSGMGVVNFINDYIRELEGLEVRKDTLVGEEEKWKALEGSLIKINCDAFFDRHGHKAALGVVIRNGRGDILVSTTRLNTEVGSTFDAEALACLDGVLTGVSLGLTEVIVEGDSRSIISKCKSGFLSF